MKLSKCIKISLILALCTLFFCPVSDAKRLTKNKPVLTTSAQPFEIDEEFKGEFKYFNAAEEKLKAKEQKAVFKTQKKHQKLLNKKQKLEQKKEKSSDNIKKYAEYKENLKNSFIPTNN